MERVNPRNHTRRQQGWDSSARLAAAACSLLLLAGCSLFGADESDSTTSSTAFATDPSVDQSGTVSPTGSRDVAEPSVAPASAEYVGQLCDIDPFGAANADDPIGALVGQLEAVAATTPQEQSELDGLIAAFEAVRGGDATERLVDATGVLRARCNRVVTR